MEELLQERPPEDRDADPAREGTDLARRRRRRAMRAAFTLGRRLTRTIDPALTHQAIVSGMAGAVHATLGALALFSRSEGALRIVATHGYPASIVDHIRIQPGEGILGRVFATGRPLLMGRTPPAIELPHRRRYRTDSFIVLPVATPAGIAGAVAVSDPLDRDAFDRNDVRTLKLCLGPAALALERQQLRQEIVDVSRAALLDSVTGLSNRHYLETRLRAEVQRAERAAQPLAVMLVDVDNFKKVNDTLGHLEGDRVLKDIAVLLSEHVRVFDVCTRFGGEEFAILMPGADRTVAIQVAERVRMAVAQAWRDGRSGIAVTVSAGVAVLQPGEDGAGLLERADQSLLRAKAEGKNAVRFSDATAS